MIYNSNNIGTIMHNGNSVNKIMHNGVSCFSSVPSSCVLFHNYKKSNASDITRNNNDGVVTNGGVFNADGLEFDGVDDYVRIAHSVSLDFTNGPFAIFITLKPDPASASAYVVSKGNVGATAQYQLRWATTSSVAFYSSGVSIVGTGNVVPASNWKDVGFIWDGVNAKSFVDCVQAYSVAFAAPLAADSSDLLIGKRADSSACFKGTIDNVAIYRSADIAAIIKHRRSIVSNLLFARIDNGIIDVGKVG